MKLQYTPLSVAITLVLSGTVHSTAFAQTSPPQPAINACNSLSQGDNCSFQTPNGTINGSCSVIGNQLACMPANGESQSPPNSGSGGTQLPSDGGTQPPPNNETGATQPPANNETGTTQPPANNETGTTQPPSNNETGATQPPPNNETGTTQPPSNNETGATQPPANNETGVTQPPSNNETGATQPPANNETGATQPPANNETGATQPPANNETGATQPPANNETGTTQPPPNNETGTTQPPANNETGTTQPPANNETGTTQPPPNNETGVTQPPPNNETGTTQPPANNETGGTQQLPPSNNEMGDTQSPASEGTPSEDSSQIPQPVIDGCIDLTEGSSCSFTTPDGTEDGICTMMQDTLGCDPNGGDISVTRPTEIGTLIGNTNNTLPDTGQTYCYDDSSAITCPNAGEAFDGQDAQYQGSPMSYTDNGNGTITDNVTGIIWQASPDTDGDGGLNINDKLSYTEAQNYCQNLTLANQTDWWLPDLKQLYSLINFDGMDLSGYDGTDISDLVPFIDTGYFDFAYGDSNAGERLIDSQYASNTRYVSTTMDDDETLFGVNFADGRIKGYGLAISGQDKTFFVICARGNDNYGQNDFVDNGDGTITDNAAHLMWAQDDSGMGLNWEEALAFVASMNAADYLGYNDWRLPNIKELQYLVDYSRSPDTTDSAAIDPLFNTTAITNEGGETDYPYFWSSTTHANLMGGANAAYMSFGRAIGSMDSGNTWLDVHGAGAQRSDPKTGNAADYPKSNGPQGDALRVFNYVRLVRDADLVGTESDAGSSAPLPPESDDNDSTPLPPESDGNDSTPLPSESDGSDTTPLPPESDGSDTTTPLPPESDGSGTTPLPPESDGSGTTPLPPELVGDNLAHFEANSELLHIPVVDAGDLGIYKVVLRFIGMDTRYTPGFLFELTEAELITGTPLATYNTQTGLVTIPNVTVDSTEYTAEMSLILEGETMRFAVSALRE